MSSSGSHLLINPFGPAVLMYDGKELARSDEIISHTLGTKDFKFLVRVNQNGSFDIQWHKGVTEFNITIETNVRVYQLRIKNGKVYVPPWFEFEGDRMMQRFSLQTPEFLEAKFRVMLLNSMLFRRTDFRFLKGSWVTMLIYDHQLMSACLHGDHEMRLLDSACREIHARATAPNAIVPENGTIQFGLKGDVRRRPRANSVASTSTVAPADSNGNEQSQLSAPMGGLSIEPNPFEYRFEPNQSAGDEANPPGLIPAGDAIAARNAYIKRLREAADALEADERYRWPNISE